MAEIKSKRCPTCKQEKPIDGFNRNRSQSDGLNSACRECQKEHYRNWRTKNKEYHAARVKKWAAKNREKQHAYHKRFRKQFPEIVRERKRQDYKRFPKSHQRRSAKWGKANPLKVIAKYQRRRARERNLPSDWTESQAMVALKHFGNTCAACDAVLAKGRTHWDHWIPIASPNCPGTVAGNMLPLCSKCNQAKWSKAGTGWLVSKFGEARAVKISVRIRDFFALVASFPPRRA